MVLSLMIVHQAVSDKLRQSHRQNCAVYTRYCRVNCIKENSFQRSEQLATLFFVTLFESAQMSRSLSTLLDTVTGFQPAAIQVRNLKNHPESYIGL